MLIILIIILCFCISLIIYLKFRAQIQKKPIKPINTEQYRTAIHEAGHFIAAWSCSHVTKIISAKINERGGAVHYEIIKDDNPDNIWCVLVIKLAGIAAEIKTYGKITSIHSKNDLESALYLADQLGNYIPKNIPDTKSLNFKSMFRNSININENYLLSSAYKQAKEIIDSQKEKFYSMAVALQNLKTIDESHAKQIMGTRVHITLVGLFAPLFVYPGFTRNKEAA